MFESTVVESKKHKIGLQKFLTLPVSIALHAIVITAVIVGAIWTVEFPTNSPAQVAQYSASAAPPPPPPPPPPTPKAAPVTRVVKPGDIPNNRPEMAPSAGPGKATPGACAPTKPRAEGAGECG